MTVKKEAGKDPVRIAEYTCLLRFVRIKQNMIRRYHHIPSAKRISLIKTGGAADVTAYSFWLSGPLSGTGRGEVTTPCRRFPVVVTGTVIRKIARTIT
jgi:hypothetical protein